MLPVLVLLAALRALPAQDQGAEARAKMDAVLAEQGLRLDLEHGLLAMPATVLVRDALLEYLLVGPSGATHESLFLTGVRPSLLNTALLLFGVQPGENARLEETGASDERGRPQRRVLAPHGDGFLLYAAWREQGELYLYRVEDLVGNTATGRTLRRHRWVFLGSRFAALRAGEPEVFVADVAGNLVNLSFFFQGDTLLTAALDECVEQTIWAPNAWLLPPRGEPVSLIFARQPITALPAGWAEGLPEVHTPPPEELPAEGSGGR